MNPLLRAEARKIFSTRSTLAVAGFVILYPALSLLPAVLAPEEPEVDAGTILQVLRGSAEVLTLAALLLGVLAVAGEHRHGTIVPSLLVSPRRGRFVAAKLGTQAAFAVMLASAVSAVALVVGTSYLARRDVSVDILSNDVLMTVAATPVVAGLYAIIGTAVGAVVKSQTAAVAGALMWVFAVENVIPLVLRNPGLRRWLAGGLSDRLLQVSDPVPDMGSPWLAPATLTAVAAALAGAAVVSTKTADVN